MARKTTIFAISIFFLIISSNVSMAEWAEWEEGTHYLKQVIGGFPGNHQIDCTVIYPLIMPDPDNPNGYKPTEKPVGGYPVIAWANGWGWNEVAGENEIDGYLPGLIEWAIEGNFIVIAANQWSPRERDVLQSVAWLIEQNDEEGDYAINLEKIGLTGHSQGGGAVLRASDGEPKGKGLGLDIDIATVIAMNPMGHLGMRSILMDQYS